MIADEVDVVENQDKDKLKKTRKRYSLEFKHEVIKYVEEHKTQSEAGRIFNVDKRLVCEWFSNKENIANSSFKRRRSRVTSGKDLARFPEMEKDLLVWFTRERDNNRSINGIDIKLAALEIHKRLYRGNISDNKNGFSASDGWLYGWLDRHNKTEDSLLLTQIPSFQPVMVLDSVIQETGSVGSINGGGGILYVQPSTSGITVLSNNSISNSSVTPYPNFVHPTSSASTIAFVPQNQSNLNHNTPVTSNDAQRNKQLIGRFVLNELAMNTQLNNVQYINKKNKEKKSAPKSNSTGNDGVTGKKRGRKCLPRDENGNIIRN